MASRPAGFVAGALLLGASGLGFVSTPARVNTNSLRGAPAIASKHDGYAGSETGSTFTSPVCSLVVAATAAAVCRRAAKKDLGPSGEEIAKTLPRPEDLLESPKYPKFQGSEGGYFSKSTRERHAITWTAKEEAELELPTGTVCIMNKGENLAYFRKKEQAICVGKALRKMKIENYKIFRIAKDGTVKFMHPADGVFPDKVNKGRVCTNFRPMSCGSNAAQSAFKFTKYHQKAWEADALSTMFVKAKMLALCDEDNLFPLPPMEEFSYSGMSEDEVNELVAKRAEEAKKIEFKSL